MKRKTVTYVMTVLLLITTIICVITGFIKWPGLITALGLTYRQVPVALITNIHDWSGLCIVVLTLVHIYQFRGMMKRMTLGLIQNKSQS
jgi:cytochrome b subunit of formate dehydrogenase